MKHSAIITMLVSALVLLPSCEKVNVGPNETHTYTLSQKKSLKRGVAQTSWFFPDTDLDALGPAMSWTYNWSSSPLNENITAVFKKYGVEFCPMAWNANYNEAGLRAAEKYILGFNEPNLTDQCNMTPSQAAQYWPAVVALAKSSGKKLVSPAMNYGTLANYHDPVVWLDEFFAIDGISLDDIDAIAIHCYMPSAGAVASFIEKFRKYGKPIWLTEFCNGNSNNISETTQMNYMCETLNMLEQNDLVERYAWFIGRDVKFDASWKNNLLSAKSPYGLKDLGKVFVNISTFDDNVVYSKDDVIPAEQYCQASGQVHLEPSSDGGILDLTDFVDGCETHYHINMPSAGSYTLKIRYQTYMESKLSFGVGDNLDRYKIQNTSHEWITESFPIELPAGRSDLVLKGGGAAGVKINWMIIQ